MKLSTAIPVAFAVACLSLSATMSAKAAPSPELAARIIHHANANGVPVALAKAVIRLESNFRPGAANAGNFGLMQLRLGTARSLGYTGAAAGLMNADTNLKYGMKYLGQAHRMARGDTCGTIMRYQSGLRATRMNGANRAYCGRAKALMARAG